MTEQIINEYLYKNISYLFTISLYNTPLYTSLRKYVINTYFYNEEDDYLTIVLSSLCLDQLELCIESKTSTNKIYGYINHEVIGNYIILKVDRTIYISDEVLVMLENTDYQSIKTTQLYKDHISKLGIQKEIVDNTDKLKELLEERFNSIVNSPWKLFEKDKETLTLDKIINMNTELKIQKAWLLSKIENAGTLSKYAYQDVLDNAVEVVAPSIIALGKQETIDYEGIYNSVKEALIKKCGKPQYQLPGINGGSTNALMFGFTDFKGRLAKVIKKYKLTDIDKVTELLCRHVSSLSYPQLQYYMIKTINGEPISKLATDYELYVENKEVSKPQSFEI